MPLTINDLMQATKTLEVKLSEEIAVKIRYRLAYMTPGFESKYRGLADGSTTQAELLAEMIDSWNLGVDGDYVKPKKGELEKLGTVIQNALWKAVWEDSFPPVA